MRIAIIGAGGVGAGFGFPLAAGGNDVIFVARGAHLAAMRRDGLRLEREDGTADIQRVQSTDDPSSIGPVDVVLFCVKNWDVETAGTAIRPLVENGGGVIPLQNGIDAQERLQPILGKSAVMAGTAHINASITAPGVVRQNGPLRRIIFGETDGSTSLRGERFRNVCAAAGLDAVLSPAIEVELWVKFVFLVALSGANAITRLPVGKLRDDADLVALIEALMREVEAVGRACGVALPADVVETWWQTIRAAPPGVMASMARDLLAGNRLELPWLAGKLVELGRRHGVPTPANAVVYAALKPYANGAPV
jgi:2-dehydropantoate 2-reductase